MNYNHLTGKRNESTDWHNVKSSAFASAIVADGYNGHKKNVLLSSVGNKLAVVDAERGYYYTDIDVQGLDQAELLWILCNNPNVKRRYHQLQCL